MLSALAAQKAVYWCRGELKGSDSAVFCVIQTLCRLQRPRNLPCILRWPSDEPLYEGLWDFPKGLCRRKLVPMALILLHKA